MSKVVEFVLSRRDDMLLFALALVIATLLFGQLQGDMEPGKEREFEVPLTFSNQHEDITILQAPRSVRVVASGSQQALDGLDTTKVRAVVDFQDAEPGVARYRIDVLGPVGSGISFRPVRANVEVEAEEKARRSLEVHLFTVGTPPGNYTYNGVTILPSEVEVSGPASNVPDVESVRAVLDLTTITPNQTIEADLEALGEGDKPVPLITITPPTVRILPAISIGPSRRNLIVTPVFSGQPAVGYRVTGYSVNPTQVEVSGESAEVSRFTTVNTERIDLTGLRRTRTFRVRLALPEGLDAGQSDEVSVTVRVAVD